jgi:hypothetical protein
MKTDPGCGPTKGGHNSRITTEQYTLYITELLYLIFCFTAYTATELLLLVEEANTAAAEAVDPLAQRNAINEALKKVSNTAAVVASVRLTARKNLLLTTTERFSADFLLQHTDAWKPAIQVTCKGMQTQEEEIQVVAHKVYMHNVNGL